MGAAVMCAVLLGAADTLLVRHAYPHWPGRALDFLTAASFWGVMATAAQLPAWLFDRYALPLIDPAPSRTHPARVTLRLFAWTALPVLLHALLDEFTALGGNLEGLAQPRPWLEVLALLVGMFFVVRVLGRLISRWPAWRTLLPASALACAAGLLVDFHEAPSPRPSRRSGQQPNLLFVVWDTARAANMTPYGYDRDTTPHLQAAVESAALFETARSVAVYTLTSHVTMLTGVHPSQHGARLMRRWFQPTDVPSVAQSLRDAGYRTAAFVGTDVLRAHSGVAYGFEVYRDRVDPWISYTHGWALIHDLQSLLARRVPALRFNGLPHWFQDYQRPADEVLAQALEWIESDDPRPWFCFVNLYDVHWPYLPGDDARARFCEPYEGIVDGYSTRGDRVHADPDYRLTEADKQRLVSLYDGEMWELDAKVDRFLGELDLERTALLMTSDHGEAFGEGGRLEHVDILECQVRVPLIVRPAGGVEGRRVDAPASGVDVAPTLLDLVGAPVPERMAGASLLGDLDPGRRVMVEHRDYRTLSRTQIALYEGPLKLVRVGAKPPFEYRLHDLTTDPEGLEDVASARPEELERLRRELEALRSSLGIDDSRGLGDSHMGDVRALQALGYMGEGDPVAR